MIKITAYSVIWVLGILLIAGVGFYVRLSYGPVSLNFMTETLQDQVNRNLAGMRVKIDGALIERAPESGVPHFRLSNIELTDTSGNMIARAPRAAVGIDEKAILSARIVPISLELIGPRIRIKRNLGGNIELGFGNPAAPEDDVQVVDDLSQNGGKTDQETPQTDEAPETSVGSTLIAILAGDSEQGDVAIQSVETIRVSNAAIKFYDEANDAIWDAPHAELAFRRMPYGFAVAANAEVANGNETGSWHAEISASYRRETRSFSVSTRITDLVPANISDEIFALAQLARFKVPLSGQAEMEITDEGLVTKASAEFAAAAGEVGFPDYMAEPVIVDEGSLRADYDPVTGGIVITESQLLVGSSRAQITGNILPVRNDEGLLSAVKISLNARNVAIDTQGTVKAPVAVDRIDFVGTAAINEAKLDIDDLVVMSGSTGVRLRGVITGGGESAGILLSGRIRDLSASLLQRLWPPIMAPKTRAWINQNIRDGRVTEGEFMVNLPVDALAKAQRDRRLPDKSIQLSFKVADVTTGYYKDLPPLQGAEGEARLKDNDFSLSVNKATIELPSGKRGVLSDGVMTANDILAPETIGEFGFSVSAPAQTIIEYIGLPTLSLLKHSGFDTSKLSGDTRATVTLQLPLIKDAPRDRVSFSAKAKITNAALAGALDKIDISDGTVDLIVGDGKMSANGPVRINGVPVKLKWDQAAGAAGRQSAVIEASLDDDDRKKIGIDLGEFLRGPVSLKAEIPDLGDPEGRIDIDADLAKAEMRIGAINWVRPPAAKTRASFSYFGKGDKGRRVENLAIKGPGVTIKGAVSLAGDSSLREAKLTDVRLSDENIFALTVRNGEDGTSIALKGDSFDARPLIKSMFGSAKSSSGDGDAKRTALNISVNVDRVHAHRGEILTGVTADIRALGSTVQAAEINGTFLSGQPVVLRITPVNGGREMRIMGRDGGAAIRAANLYSKIAGGQIEFYALMANDANSSIRQGKLVLRNFEVRNEAALAQLDTKGKPKKSGPRKEGLAFKRLTLPFTTDAKFVRIGDSLVKGVELGASAEGLIRKSDGAIDITGTIIPAYALNSAIGEIPLFGDILAGGKGQGVIGLTFALGGSIDKPVFQVNPMSAIAPGILRKFFEYGNTGGGTPVTSSRNTDKQQN
ncbi:MAG: AsmA-like C-terminal domain-containing protein [Alphaproteobacteria bacterium]|nr:AsmA-like C-terminal domain-containing protein [Alphaproteobacteria bacterium]